jgi:CMP/dCMP kinase
MPPEPETNPQHKINIAIDGFSSCGKSTLAKALARELHYRYLDTGAMYRAIGYFALNHGLVNKEGNLDTDKLIQSLSNTQVGFDIDSETGVSQVSLAGQVVEPFIRNLSIATLASKVSQIRQVRDHMQILQKQLATEKGVVMDGRDIGTVVMPNAELKIFMTAEPTVRARRRQIELEGQGKVMDLKTILEQQIARDYEDENRKEDPLRQAEDARILDNTDLTAEQQLALALYWVHQAKHKEWFLKK